MTSVGLDLILFTLFVVTVSLFWLLQTGRLDSREEDAESHQIIARLGIRWLYPRRLLRQAGLPIEKSRRVYWALKGATTLFVVLVLLTAPSGHLPVLLSLSLMICSFFSSDLWLLWRRHKRISIIENSIEFFVNLINVYLQSGFSLSRAFDHAADYGLEKNNPLAQEIRLLAREIESGRSRQVAFANLAMRTGAKQLERLAVIVQVGMGVGAPVTDGLESFAEFLRLQRRQQDTARVNRKSLETMLPMLLVCFPMFLVLVFFPAAIQILEVLALLGDTL